MQVMTTQLPAWQVMACVPVVRTPERLANEARRLRRVGVTTQVADPRSGLRSGQVVWATGDDDEAIRLAWEWEELCADVVALADPMNILSNVALVDSGGHVVGRSLRMVCLNQLVHALPWREQIMLGALARTAH